MAAWLVWSWERDHTPAEYVEYVEVIIRQTPWMPPEWWTSGKWREGLPEPTEHRTLFRVVGHGDAFGLLKASGEADW